MLFVSSFVDRKCGTIPSGTLSHFYKYNQPITFVELLKSRQSILGAEKSGGIVLGFISRTKYGKYKVKICCQDFYLFCILAAFSPLDKKIMIGFLDIRDCLY